MRAPGSAAAKRAVSCGVRLISGTSSSTCPPRAIARAGRRRVDLGLAAAGHAFEQRHARSARPPRRSRRPRRAARR
jgi:hypothetical protein